MVAVRPASTCHSMWQWKRETREEGVSWEREERGERGQMRRERGEMRGEVLIWIVGFEAEDEVAACCDHDGVAAHGGRGWVLEGVRVKGSGVCG
jgi:hypothetical protein